MEKQLGIPPPSPRCIQPACAKMCFQCRVGERGLRVKRLLGLKKLSWYVVIRSGMVWALCHVLGCHPWHRLSAGGGILWAGLGLRHCFLAAQLQGMTVSLAQEGDLVPRRASPRGVCPGCVEVSKKNGQQRPYCHPRPSKLSLLRRAVKQ